MVFAEGLVSGYFSGGCVEADIADHAHACLADGQSRRLVYGQGSPWPDIQLLCGAGIEIFLERILPDSPALADLLSAEDERRPVSWFSDGARQVCSDRDKAAPWPDAVQRDYDPPQKLVVFGSDPTALAIAQLGAQSGLQTTFVRPKGPETRRRFRASPIVAMIRSRPLRP